MQEAIQRLGALYGRYGYSQYKMNKFEEYDLYARNKDFLISDSVITFTDKSGKLMALKPDVTLSIVKNSKDTAGSVQKLYYNENVYRVAKGSNSFKEIVQVGLECLGNIDTYCISEVLRLAAESLRSISCESVLEISHLGLVSGLLDALEISNKTKVLALIGEKNLHELAAVCKEMGISEEKQNVLRSLISFSGAPETVLPKVKQLLEGIIDTQPLKELTELVNALAEVGSMLRLDFSVVDDIHYYNGIVFKGFIRGLPSAVLSGGQYDRLMQKLGRKARAIGFAVYVDLLERLEEKTQSYDVDTVLLYDSKTALEQIQKQVKMLAEQGSVMAQPALPADIRYRRLLSLKDGRLEVLKENA